MRQFRVKSNEINYQQMIKDLLSAVKYTSMIHGWNLHEQLNATIKSIIFRNQYNCITGGKGFRSNVKKYSADDFVNLIIEYNKSNQDSTIKNVSSKNGFYFINDNSIEYLVDKICVQYLNRYLDNISLEYPNNDIVYKPKEVIYNTPSNECRDAVLSGKQTRESYSSAICNGMMAYSDVGLIRQNQEDSYYIGVHPNNPNFKIMVVADGMGGYEGGEIASNIAVRDVIRWFESLDIREFYNRDNNEIYEKFYSEVQNINRDILNHTSGGTTLCVAIIKNDNIVTFNIGDSKGYIFENNHLVFNTLPEDAAHLANIPEPLTRFYKEGNKIYNYLGCNDYEHIPTPKRNVIQIKPDNSYKIILCSDGVTDCLGDKKIVDIASENGNVAQALVECALENESYLKHELSFFGLYDGKRINKSLYNSEIQRGKDNATAVFGEIEPKVELQGRRR